MDVSSVHHAGALLRYSVSLLGYGFYGDIIKDSESKRWMGLIRYDFSGEPRSVPEPGLCPRPRLTGTAFQVGPLQSGGCSTSQHSPYPITGLERTRNGG